MNESVKAVNSYRPSDYIMTPINNQLEALKTSIDELQSRVTAAQEGLNVVFNSHAKADIDRCMQIPKLIYTRSKSPIAAVVCHNWIIYWYEVTVKSDCVSTIPEVIEGEAFTKMMERFTKDGEDIVNLIQEYEWKRVRRTTNE